MHRVTCPFSAHQAKRRALFSTHKSDFQQAGSRKEINTRVSISCTPMVFRRIGTWTSSPANISAHLLVCKHTVSACLGGDRCAIRSIRLFFKSTAVVTCSQHGAIQLTYFTYKLDAKIDAERTSVKTVFTRPTLDAQVGPGI